MSFPLNMIMWAVQCLNSCGTWDLIYVRCAWEIPIVSSIAMLMRACGGEYSRMFVLFTRLGAAGCTIDTGRGPTWCARETDADSSPDDEGYTAASLPRRCAVHARYDYASCAGG
jgi:hypothetical protein